MSALIEKIRLETRTGNFAKVKRIISTNTRHFASLTKAEQNILLLAMINIRDPKHLFHHLGPEQNEEIIIKLGEDEFKHQLIIAHAHMWYGSEQLAFRITSRLESILKQKKMIFKVADQKRIVENIASVYHAQAKFKQVVQLISIYPKKIISETQHIDTYFFRKYYSALFNKTQTSPKPIKELIKLRENTSDPMIRLFLFCDICIMSKIIGSLKSIDIAKKIKKENLLKIAEERGLQIPWFMYELALAEIERKKYSAGKKLLIKSFALCNLPADIAMALTVFHFHFPEDITLGQSVFLWCYHGENVYTYPPASKDPYNILIKQEISKGDSWLISRNHIQPCFYNDTNSTKNFIDLNAGLILIDNIPHILSEKRTQFLVHLISKGHLGCTEIDLITTVYPEILVHLAPTKIGSLKNLAIQFKALGIHIKKIKGIYYYSFDKNKFDIILPMSLHPVGLKIYCKKSLKAFSSAELAKHLQIKRTTAFKLIKDWKQTNQLKQISSKQYSLK